MATDNTVLPTAWATAEMIDGFDLVDKAELVGMPFLITGCNFQMNKDEVSFVYVDGERPDGTTFTFNDSSSGVRKQMVEHLVSKGLDHIVDSGEFAELSLVIPRGLRFSEFEVAGVVDRRTRLPKMSKTYYLTTSGVRPIPVTGSTAATPGKRASKAPSKAAQGA